MKANKKILSTVITVAILLFNTNLYSQLSGNYTIGAGGNYSTISDAVNDLNSLGVNGPVIFNIKTGSYNEYFTINSFTGSSSVNTVTFRSQSGNASDVILNSDAADSVLLKINGADNIKLENITFTDTLNSTSQRNRIMFYGNCDNINITGCKFTGGLKGAGITSGGSATKNLLVDRCEFTTRTGFQFTALSPYSEFTKITNSNFNCVYCIYMFYQTSFTIEKNILTGNAIPDYIASFCLRFDGCNGDVKIVKNRMNGISDAAGLYPVDGIISDPFRGTSALIANNMISINRGTCIALLESVNMKIVYNTLKCDLAPSGNITLITDTNFILMNNILIQTANDGRRTLTYYISGSPIISDYNNLYCNGSYLLFYRPTYFYISSLTQFKTLTGLDMHSKDKPVQFVSEYDLHLAGTSLHDTDLIGIPIPEVTDDIDGQPRNPLYPYKGADEADFPLPVELSSLTSSVDKINVTLNWTTSSESNNSGFDIERSDIKGQTSDEWIRIGFIEGNGTSNSQHNYSYTDKNLNSGKYKYRLKQIDFNGNFTYFNLSNEVVIGVPEKYSLSQNYPNPFNPVTRLGFGISDLGFVTLKIYDILGNEIKTLVNEIKPAGYYEVEFNGSDLSSGIYFYKLEAGSFKETRRMMLVK